jgi:hypothetical protein
MDLDYYGGIFLGKSNTAAIVLWSSLFVPKENALYHCSRARFYYICSWFLSFYDPTIGFGLEVMTSNLID